jgi:hypothetical protein
MNKNIQDYIARPKRYENIDGTSEMIVSLTLFGFALAGYLEELLPEHSMTWIRVMVVYASLWLAVGSAYWIRRMIKRHITWPRTGYVAYRRGKSWWLKITLIIINALVFVVMVAFLIKRGHVMSMWNLSPKTWNPRVVLLVAISIIAYLFQFSRRNNGHRWKWSILFLMILGVIIFVFLAPRDFGQWARPPVLLIAFLWLCSSIGTFYSYVHNTKPVALKSE